MFIPAGVLFFILLFILSYDFRSAEEKEWEATVKKNKDRAIQEAMKLPFPECFWEVNRLKRSWGDMPPLTKVAPAPSQAERPLIEIAEDWVWDLNWKYKVGFVLLCGIVVAIAA